MMIHNSIRRPKAQANDVAKKLENDLFSGKRAFNPQAREMRF